MPTDRSKPTTLLQDKTGTNGGIRGSQLERVALDARVVPAAAYREGGQREIQSSDRAETLFPLQFAVVTP
jgi:hypothetical protein